MPSIEIIAARDQSPANDDELRKMRAAAFHKRDFVAIHLDEVKNWADRQHLINIAERLFGKRAAQPQGGRR